MAKTALEGKETILRTLSQGDIFAAPALLGNAIAPATVTAESDLQVLAINREVLLAAIWQNPEIALQILAVFNHPKAFYDLAHIQIILGCVSLLIFENYPKNLEMLTHPTISGTARSNQGKAEGPICKARTSSRLYAKTSCRSSYVHLL